MARKGQDNPQLDMTPMIDVVFELIIFFVVTIKQQDLLTKLNANRPAPSNAPSDSVNDDKVEIQIGAKGKLGQAVLVYNGTEMRLDAIRTHLSDIAKTSKTTPILVKCTGDSPHKGLVDVLDACYEYGLHSVSIFSLDNTKAGY